MDPKVSAHVAQRSNGTGDRSDKDLLPGKKQQGYRCRAQLLHSQPTPHELPKGSRSQAPAWKRCHGKRDTPRGELASEGRFHLLVRTKRGGNAHAAILL